MKDHSLNRPEAVISRRGNFFNRLALGLSLLLADTLALTAQTPTSTSALTCAVLTREGKVEVARKGVAHWSPAQTNQILNIGDRLRTGLRSRATLRWSDLSIVRVDELTSMELQPPEKSKTKPQLELKSGATYFFSREKPEEIQFRTPVASGAIRGTEFNLAVDENGRTVLSLLDGEVDLGNAQGQATLHSGDQAVIVAGQAPQKSPLLDALNVIQWALYYPAVTDPEELGLSAPDQQTFAPSLKAYRAGDLGQALTDFPENRAPGSDAERALQASLLLAAGRVPQAQATLAPLGATSPVARALREVIAAVKHETLTELPSPSTASEWVARSYYQQSRFNLPEALAAARAATTKAPNFGAAWVRLAELEFSFGRTAEALTALDRGLELSPRHAQGLALKGFVLAARGKLPEAMRFFDDAIAADGALGNAWLGRGLVKIRSGQTLDGRNDLQVAATLEPQRSVLRSYLGKAWSQGGDAAHARKELAQAVRLDANDPTGWFYAALLDQRENRINDAIGNLEKARSLNDNRGVFRSRELLDQDRSVRSANLASIYRDAGLYDRSVQEAASAVNSDYANYSAHLFLAESFNALRDPKLINLRYETPWFSELLIANLLGPAAGGTLSPNVAYQEYTRFFDKDRFGVFSDTEYASSGDWLQRGSQYGIFGNSSYSFDALYRKENGQRPNNDLEQVELSLRFKHQLTEKDGLFFEISRFDSESGDVAQYYDQSSASKTLRVTETQSPNVLLGYHRAWAPGSDTLALFGRFDDTLTMEDANPLPPFYSRYLDPLGGGTNQDYGGLPFYSLDYRSELVAYSTELQHIFQTHRHTLVAGGRFQMGESETHSELDRAISGNVTNQRFDTDLSRVSIYAYENWQIIDPLRLTAGVSYDHLEFPVNIDTSPLSPGEDSESQLSPKAGLLFTPLPDTRLRAMYSQSLGGAFFDQSVRLEPTQIGGFNQAFRSAIPESVAGLVPGTSFETWGVGFDQALRATRTYLTVEGQMLNSDASRTVGIFRNADINTPSADVASSAQQSLDYREQALIVALNQLAGRDWAFGTRYKLTHSELEGRSSDLPATVAEGLGIAPDTSATLHQINLYGTYHHSCGFFARFDSIWSQQDNSGDASDLPDANFWQHNVSVGYRFLQRRAEVRLSVLNLTDRDYRLNPLTLYNELPRERTLVVGLRLFF